MGRLSNRNKSCLNNLRKVRQEQTSNKQKETSVPEAETNEPSIVTETLPITNNILIPFINSDLKDNLASNKKEVYSRGPEYSPRYLRKLKQKNREMAKGSAKTSSFFYTLAIIESPPPPPQPQLEDTLKIAYDALSIYLTPSFRANKQQDENIYERSKCQAVHHYFKLRMDGVKKMEASVLAANMFWYSKKSTYRSKDIRKYAEEYLKTGKISECLQGKHPKRGLIA